jgi:cytidylate kinase
MRKPLVIAIDGPSGAGKGTVARAIAKELGYRHVDSGAMYRAVGWKARRDGVPLDDEAAVAALAEGARIDVTGTHVTIDGIDVAREIRTPAIDRAAASVARLPRVRSVLVEQQRRMGIDGGIVMEGRDIGTVVFPDAGAKFFLTASSDERARRRVAELQAAGRPADLATTLAEMKERDERDSTRAVAPLKQADDAIAIDSSGLTPDEVVSKMATLVATKVAAIVASRA